MIITSPMIIVESVFKEGARQSDIRNKSINIQDQFFSRFFFVE